MDGVDTEVTVGVDADGVEKVPNVAERGIVLPRPSLSSQVQKGEDSFVLTQVPDGSDCLVKHLPEKHLFWDVFSSGGVERKPLQTVPGMIVFPQKVLPRKKEWKDD